MSLSYPAGDFIAGDLERLCNKELIALLNSFQVGRIGTIVSSNPFLGTKSFVRNRRIFGKKYLVLGRKNFFLSCIRKCTLKFGVYEST